MEPQPSARQAGILATKLQRITLFLVCVVMLTVPTGKKNSHRCIEQCQSTKLYTSGRLCLGGASGLLPYNTYSVQKAIGD